MPVMAALTAAELRFREAQAEDMPRLQAIRRAAFAPVFASFRSANGLQSGHVFRLRFTDTELGRGLGCHHGAFATMSAGCHQL